MRGIDTGTTNILIAKDIAKEYYAKVSGSESKDGKQYTIPCDATMPDFTIRFSPPALVSGAPSNFPAGNGGVKRDPYEAVVSGKYLIGNHVSNQPGSKCVGSLQGNDKGNGWDAILGDVFLMSQVCLLLSLNSEFGDMSWDFLQSV